MNSKIKGIFRTVLSALPALAMALVTIDIGTCCMGWAHQPKVPEAAKKLKRTK